MSDVPSEIVLEILAWVPAQSLLRFRSVCKEWRRLIDAPFFIKSHTKNQHSNTLLIRTYSDAPSSNALYFLLLDSLNFTDDFQTIDPTPVTKLIHRGMNRLPVSQVASCSCNGLILLPDFYIRNNIWVIWNPLTRKFHELTRPLDVGIGVYSKGSGLGYDYAADDYKVVRIDNLSRDGVFVHQTRIYSLRYDSWRIIRDCPYHICDDSEGVFLNGALHWQSRVRIIVLDLATEDYHHLSLPPIPIKQNLSKLHLEALGGYLFLSYYDYKRKCFEGWVMNDYGVEKSWMKLFSIKNLEVINASPRPVAYFKSKRHVLLRYVKGFFWVDIENDLVKKVAVNGVSRISNSYLCPGSLFPLGDGCGIAVNRTD